MDEKRLRREHAEMETILKLLAKADDTVIGHVALSRAAHDAARAFRSLGVKRDLPYSLDEEEAVAPPQTEETRGSAGE